MSTVIVDPRQLRIGNILLFDNQPVHVTLLSLDIDDEYQDIIGFCPIGQDTGERSDWNRAFGNRLRRVDITSKLLRGLFGQEVSPSSSPHTETYSFQTAEATYYIVNKGEVWHFMQGLEVVSKLIYLDELQNTFFAFRKQELKVQRYELY